MTVSNEMKGSMKIIDIAMMTQDAIFAESHLDSLILQLKENFIINKSRDYSYQFATAIAEQSFKDIISTVRRIKQFHKGGCNIWNWNTNNGSDNIRLRYQYDEKKRKL